MAAATLVQAAPLMSGSALSRMPFLQKPLRMRKPLIRRSAC